MQIHQNRGNTRKICALNKQRDNPSVYEVKVRVSYDEEKKNRLRNNITSKRANEQQKKKKKKNYT